MLWIIIGRDSIALERAVAKAVASGRHPDGQFGATYRVSFGATKCLVIIYIHSSWHTPELNDSFADFVRPTAECFHPILLVSLINWKRIHRNPWPGLFPPIFDINLLLYDSWGSQITASAEQNVRPISAIDRVCSNLTCGLQGLLIMSARDVSMRKQGGCGFASYTFPNEDNPPLMPQHKLQLPLQDRALQALRQKKHISDAIPKAYQRF